MSTQEEIAYMLILYVGGILIGFVLARGIYKRKLNSDKNDERSVATGLNSSTEADTIKKLTEVLEDCEDYFESKADADHKGEGLVPNKEMKLLSEIRKCLKK